MKETFDTLYEEGAEDARSMMNVGLHCRIAGPTGRANGLDRFIAYAKAPSNSGSPAASDIARTWLDQFPPGPLDIDGRPMSTPMLGVVFVVDDRHRLAGPHPLVDDRHRGGGGDRRVSAGAPS